MVAGPASGVLLGALAIICVSGTAVSAVLWSIRRCRDVSYVVLCIAVAIGLGFINIDQRRSGQFAAGLRCDAIVWIQGIMLEDGAPLQGGRSRYLLQAVKCGNISGSEATASGRLTIIMDHPPEHLTGEIVGVPIDAIRGDEANGWVGFQAGTADSLGWGNPVHEMRGGLFSRLSERVRNFTGKESDLFSALLLGIRQDPADPLISMFRRAGVSHVLALSGMHLGIVASVLLFASRPLVGFRTAYLLLLPALGSYIFLVGLRPSLLRAGVMYVLWAAKVCRGRHPDTLSVLALASIGVLAVLPHCLSSVSFQLSFLALLGIITLGGSMSRHLGRLMPRGLALSFSMSAGAQAATLPVVAAQFGVFYPMGLVMTLVISPLIVLYIWTGILFVLLSVLAGQLPALDLACGAAYGVMAAVRRLMIFSASYVSSVPGIAVGPGVATVSGGLCAALLFLRRLRELRARYARYTLRFTAGVGQTSR